MGKTKFLMYEGFFVILKGIGFSRKHTLPIDRFCILYGIAELAEDKLHRLTSLGQTNSWILLLEPLQAFDTSLVPVYL